MLKESYRRHYLLKQQASSLRESWLLDLAAAKAKVSGTCQNSMCINLMRQERQRRAGRRLKRVLGKGIGRGLIKVSVQEGEDLVELTDKALIENATHAENAKKFSQTESTPAMSDPLVEELGF